MSSERTASGKGFTFINAGTIVQGEMLVENDLSIEGTLKGMIRATGTVTVTSQGVVEGDIQARSAKIGGKVAGNVTVAEKIVLEARSTLIGDLRTRELVIHEGAHFHGQCDMQPGARSSTSAS